MSTNVAPVGADVSPEGVHEQLVEHIDRLDSTVTVGRELFALATGRAVAIGRRLSREDRVALAAGCLDAAAEIVAERRIRSRRQRSHAVAAPAPRPVSVTRTRTRERRSSPAARRASAASSGDDGSSEPPPGEPPAAHVAAAPNDVGLVRDLFGHGLSAGEAVRVARQARVALDFTIETLHLAAARVLEREAELFDGIGREQRAIAHEIRHLRGAS